MNALRADDPRLVALMILGLLTGALWLAAWSVMGASDYSLVELCRSAITGVPLSEKAQ